MNPEYNSHNKDHLNDEIDVSSSDSIDAFIKELEAKEKALQISTSDLIVEIEELDADQEPEGEIEKLFEVLQNPVEPKSFTNPANNNYFPNHQAVSALEKELQQLRNEASKLEHEKTEMNELLRRRQLDFDNYRKRVERDKSETFRNLLCNLAMKMLPVVDNLTRALDSTAGYTADRPIDFNQFVDGIRLVYHQLDEVLEEMGIQPIISVGEPFNPHFHEAVAMEQTNEVAPNMVMAELLRGYFIDDKVIRHSMVKVSAPAVNPVNLSKANIPYLENDMPDLEIDD